MAASSARARRALRRNAVQAAEREEVRALAVGYLRVSTDEQAQRGNSLPEQEQAIRAYATAVGLELVEVLADPGVSGTVKPAERPGFSQVLQLAADRRFSVLLVKRFDRLARNIALAVTTSSELDTLHGVTIRSVTEAIDTGSPSGKLIFGVLSAMAEQERSVIIMFMTPQALDQFRRTAGWKIGVDGSVAIITVGVGGSIDTNKITSPVIGFILDPKGLMYNLTLEGTKISRISR